MCVRAKHWRIQHGLNVSRNSFWHEGPVNTEQKRNFSLIGPAGKFKHPS